MADARLVGHICRWFYFRVICVSQHGSGFKYLEYKKIPFIVQLFFTFLNPCPSKCFQALRPFIHTKSHQNYHMAFIYSSLIHPRHISTALSHIFLDACLSSVPILGSKIVRSVELMSFKSSTLDHTPVASPAAIAAPSEVVSRMAGRSTRIPLRSACVCIQRSELDRPPSTAREESARPESLAMASRMAAVWWQAASRVARAMWPFWECAVRPTVVMLVTLLFTVFLEHGLSGRETYRLCLWHRRSSMAQRGR